MPRGQMTCQQPGACRGAVLVYLAAAILTGCGDEGGGDSTHQAAFSSLVAYGVHKGTVKVEVEATGTPALELLAGGTSVGTLTARPYSFSWNTTKSSDGLVKLSLREQGSEGPTVADEVTVVVLNKGAEAAYHKGVCSGALAVPAAGGDNPHVSFTWTMPDDGTKEVLALLFWTDSSIHMELATGVGCCATSGTTGATGQAASPPAIATFVETKELPLPVSMKWFVDASAINPGEVAGKKTDLNVKVYLLK